MEREREGERERERAEVQDQDLYVLFVDLKLSQRDTD